MQIEIQKPNGEKFLALAETLPEINALIRLSPEGQAFFVHSIEYCIHPAASDQANQIQMIPTVLLGEERARAKTQKELDREKMWSTVLAGQN